MCAFRDAVEAGAVQCSVRITHANPATLQGSFPSAKTDKMLLPLSVGSCEQQRLTDGTISRPGLIDMVGVLARTLLEKRYAVFWFQPYGTRREC